MLDLRTLVLISTLSSAVFLFATVVLWRLQRDRPALLDWLFAAGVSTVSNFLLALRGEIPDFFSVVLGNSLLVLATGWLFIASRGLLADDRARAWRWVILAETALSVVGVSVFVNDTEGRIALVSVLVAPPLFAAGWVFFRHGAIGSGLAMRLSTLVLFGGGLVFVARGLLAVRGIGPIDYESSTQYLIAIPYLFSNLFSIWFAVMLTVIVSVQIQDELKFARDEARATNRELEVLAETDSLTQLSNRMRLDDVLIYELRRAQRRRLPLSIVMVDIDHFKWVNDEWGHTVGDEALVSVAQTLRDCLRSSDTIGRWGGEEFLVILPGTTTDQALEVAEKIRTAVASRHHGTAGDLTVSLGVTASLDGDSPGRIVNRADEALYQAKWGGRNRAAAG